MTYPSVQTPAPTRLDEPLYGASPREAFVRFWTKYATFSGRASRSEFWWWTLISFVISAVISVFGIALVGGDMTAWNASFTKPDDIVSYVFGLATLIPTLALGTRRLHDTDRSGWLQLLLLIPLVGVIILIVWWASASIRDGERYDKAFR